MSFFKRLFGLAKSDSEEEIKLNYEVADLKIGYVLEYDLDTWIVEDVAVYTWDNGARDYEYTIANGKKKLFLSYVVADGSMGIYWEGKMKEVWANARTLMQQGRDLQGPINYDGKVWHNAGNGVARVKNSKERFEMENWLFEDENEEYLISFNKYQDGSSEVYLGKHLGEHAVTNILPKG